MISGKRNGTTVSKDGRWQIPSYTTVFIKHKPLNEKTYIKMTAIINVMAGQSNEDVTSKFIIDGDKLSINFEGLTIFHNINEVLSAISNLQNKVVFLDYIDFLPQRLK